MSAFERAASREAPPAAILDPALQPALYAALSDAMEQTGAVAGVIYLIDTDGRHLIAAMIIGTAPAAFSLLVVDHDVIQALVGMDVEAPFATPTAWRAGRTAILGEPAEGDVVHISTDRIRLPFPYSAIATPVYYTNPHGERRGGVMTIVRIPERDGPLRGAHHTHLKGIAARLADRLADFEERGIPVWPGVRPTVVPIFPVSRPSDWGLHVPGDDVHTTGSIGMSMMYVVHACYPAFSRARTLEDVARAVRMRVMTPLGAQAFVLTAVSENRQWVVGRHGVSGGTVRSLHGIGAEGNTPLVDVLNDATPQFWLHVDELRAAYPSLREPTPFDGCDSWAIIPLRSSGGPVGTLSLGWRDPFDVSPEEQGLISMLASLLGAAVDRARLGEAEHALASSLQSTLLPGALPTVAELSMTARYVPAAVGAGLGGAGLGGDWYDVIAPADGRVWLVVGDVEGHALEAAGIMGQLRSAVRAYAAERHDPAAVLTRASAVLAEESSLLATCCLMRLDPADGTLEVALAGHPAPVVRSPDGAVAPLDVAPGVPLGVSPASYHSFDYEIEPRTAVMLYTDGLCGRRSDDVRVEAAGLLAGVGVDGLVDRDLEQAADRLIGLAPTDRPDDAALLLVRYDAVRGTPHRRIAQMHIDRHDLGGVAKVRRFVHEVLTGWHCTSIIDDVELGASEVVTNALTHADSGVDVRLREFPDNIRVEVRDTTASPPVPSSLSITDEEENEQAEGGRGLLIVACLAQQWGSSPSGRGKTVWFEKPRDGAMNTDAGFASIEEMPVL